MQPAVLLTNNNTLDVVTAGGTITAAGAGALRYRDGKFAGSSAALVEEGTTNYIRDPGWEGGTVPPPNNIVATNVVTDAWEGDHALHVEATSSTFATIEQSTTGLSLSGGLPITTSAYARGNDAPSYRIACRVDYVGGGLNDAVGAVNRTVPLTWGRLVSLSQIPDASKTINRIAAQLRNRAGVANVIEVDGVQVEQKDHATTFCPEIDGSGNLLPGYAWTGTANNSPSTRAAASITIPYSGTVGSLATWYSEDLGQTWQWHYAEALGSIGTYGDIADDGSGNLVITSDRALLLGPLAVWSDTLSAGQQAGVQAYSDVWTWADISSVPVTLDTAMTAAGTSAATLGSAVTLDSAGTAAGTSTATMSAELARLLDTSMEAAGTSTATLGTTMDLLTAMFAAGTSTAVMHPEAGPLPQLGSVTYTERPRPLAIGYTPIPSPIAVGYTPRPPSED